PIVLGVRLSSIRAPRHPRSPLFPYTTLFRSLQSPAAYAHEQLVGLQAVFHAEGLRRADDGRQTRSRGEAAVRRLYLLLAAQRYLDRKSTRLNSSHVKISYAVFCLKKTRGERG